MKTHVPATLTALGLATLVAGLFLPWLRSGVVLRDSFESVGVIRAIGVLRGTGWAWLPVAWIGLVPVAALAVAGLAAGLRRAGAGLAVVVSLVAGTVAGVATVQGPGEDSPLGIAGTGPTTTLVGAAVAVLGAAVVFAGGRAGARSTGGAQ
ncbi:hypothetical protein [Actinokineospora bangkokensis]|uniref:hypothetical protein n=1 Tax=Actinokineospora bangkokensis TaxID=1193682 RepID=UPI001178BF62|nr:hypothetical protein [Actinokineospora bangkokensis]